MGDADPMSLTPPPPQKFDIGFLVLYVSTTYCSMNRVVQSSPFALGENSVSQTKMTDRGMDLLSNQKKTLWYTKIITVRVFT
jgi:hypothetical protein